MHLSVHTAQKTGFYKNIMQIFSCSETCLTQKCIELKALTFRLRIFYWNSMHSFSYTAENAYLMSEPGREKRLMQ